MQFSFKTLLILICLFLLQIQSFPLSEKTSLSIDNPQNDVESTNPNKYGEDMRFLQGTKTTSSKTTKITMKNGKWIAAIVGGAVLVTILVGCTIFWCIKKRLDNLERTSASPTKVAPFRPTKVDQLQYGHPGERLESDQSIMAVDNSAIPFVNQNLTIQPTFVGYEKQMNTEESPTKGREKRLDTEEETEARGDKSTIEPPPPLSNNLRDYNSGVNESNFAEELANALEL